MPQKQKQNNSKQYAMLETIESKATHTKCNARKKKKQQKNNDA